MKINYSRLCIERLLCAEHIERPLCAEHCAKRWGEDERTELTDTFPAHNERKRGGDRREIPSISEAECEEQLVSGLPPASFRSSSQLSASHGPAFAKLNRREGAGGWTPLVSDRGQWLQVDLGRRTEIRRVATQGSYGSPHWVTEFSLLSSDGGTNWKEHRRQEGGPGFPGNSNADSVSQQVLSPPLRARLVRLVPLAWHRQIGLRLGLFGCAFRSDVATVDGTGRLVYSPAGVRPGPCPPTVSLHFKTLQAHGVLLSWTGPHGTPLTLGLVRGHLLLLLLLRAGEASRTVRLGSLLDDGHWHRVVLEHCQGGGNLTVDGHSQAFALPRAGPPDGRGDQLTLGGPAGSSPPPPAPPGNFRGCLENVYHNGVSVLDLARRGDPQVRVTGNVSFSCPGPGPWAAPVTLASPEASLVVAAAPGPPGPLAVRFRFRTWERTGRLLTTSLGGGAALLALGLTAGGKLRLSLVPARGPPTFLTTGGAWADGQWHAVALRARGRTLGLHVDQEALGAQHRAPPEQLRAGRLYRFGGELGGTPPSGGRAGPGARRGSGEVKGRPGDGGGQGPVLGMGRSRAVREMGEVKGRPGNGSVEGRLGNGSVEGRPGNGSVEGRLGNGGGQGASGKWVGRGPFGKWGRSRGVWEMGEVKGHLGNGSVKGPSGKWVG
uniref:Contactin associated protein like 3 n=1 Tax=Ornithorhynchus anatinus TaxID=9258 RepID=F6TRT3_ORNAN